MKKILLVSALSVLFLASVSARQREPVFVSATGGANICFENLFGAVSKREQLYSGTTAAFSANFGLWATDCVAFGAGYNGFRLKNSLAWFPQGGMDFNYVYGGVFWDLTNTIHGYNPKKVVNFVLDLTLGANLCSHTRFVAGVGISVPINLWTHFSLVPDVQFIGTADSSYDGGNSGVFGILVPSFGIRVSF